MICDHMKKIGLVQVYKDNFCDCIFIQNNYQIT